MDFTLSDIVRKAGLDFITEYNDGDVNHDPVTFKFILKQDFNFSDAVRKSIIARVANNLNLIKFIFTHVAFEKNQRGQGPDYWAFVIRKPYPIHDREISRDPHGNLIFTNSKKRAA